MSDQEDTGQLAVRRAGMEHKGDFKPAANLLTQLARGWAAGTAGLPGDIEGVARLLNKYTTLNPAVRAQDTTPLLPTSEFYKEWLPGKDEGVGGKELNDLASLFGGAGSTTLARGAAKAGKGALTLADAAARNAAVPRQLSSQAGVIKAPGGNWLSGSVEDALRGLKTTIPDRELVARAGMNPDNPGRASAEAVNFWVDKQLARYVKNDMATERDPIRALAERGVLHYEPQPTSGPVQRAMEHRVESGFPSGGNAYSELARNYETMADSSIGGHAAGDWMKNASPAVIEKNPWIAKVPPEVPVYEKTNPGLAYSLGFDHLMDELRNATNPASGLPRELQLDIKSLDRLSVPQAVERVAKINDWRAAQKIEANAALANNPAAHLVKEYQHSDAMPNPKGLRWVELKMPQLQEGWTASKVTEPGAYYGSPMWTGPDGAVHKGSGDNPMTKLLADQLKYEGDTMGHCVGGYCDDVASGRSRIFSLRDAKGQPHVTIETKPGAGPEWAGEKNKEIIRLAEERGIQKYMAPGNEALWAEAERNLAERGIEQPKYIQQIKGKGNKKPNDEYLPFVQDFVKSGKWSDVGDLQNAGLYDTSKGLADFTPASFQADRNMRTLAIGRAKAAGDLQRYMSRNEWEDVLKKHLPTPDEYTPKFASGGSVPNNPYTIDAAAFHSAVDPLLGGANMWQAHDDSPQKLALQLGNGATWNVGGGEGTYGSGVYKYDPITEADDKRYQEALAAYNATGLATFNPDNIAVGSSSWADRANMFESWLGSGGAIGGLRTGAQGFDVGDAGHVEGHTPTYEDWVAALAKDAPGYDPNKPIYRVRGDMSQLLGKPDSRMFLDAGYQEIDGRMVPLGTPSRTYQKSVGAENISMLSALLAPYAVGTALTNAAASGGTAMAQAAAEANAANAAQGFGQLGMAGAAPAAGLGEQAIAAYQAAQPYLKAANTVGALARGNPMGALGGYLPGMDLGLGDFGNTVANGAVKAGLSGGNPLLGAVSGAVGDAIPDTLRPYLPLAQSLVAATEGKLSLTQALNMLARYNSSSSKGA